MAERDLQDCLPRLRRLGLCLFCNIEEGDGAVAIAIEKVPENLIEKGCDDQIIKFLFQEILLIASVRFQVNDEIDKPALKIGNGSYSDNMFIKAVSELDLAERAVVALHILEGFSEAETATMMNISESEVRRTLQSARSHLSREVSSANNINQQSISV